MKFINDIIILTEMFMIFVLYKKNKYGKLSCCLFVAYNCTPAFWALGSYLNGTYLITLAVLFICIHESKGIKISKDLLAYIGVTILSILIYFFAGILNGVINKTTMVNFAGMLNLMISTVGTGLFLKRCADKDKVITDGIIVIDVIHMIFGAIQLSSLNWGYSLTSFFYGTSSHTAPLHAMKEYGTFIRVFGACYSPTILGGYVVIACAFLIGIIIRKSINNCKYRKELWVLFITLLLGLFAFSKSVIIGIFALYFAGLIILKLKTGKLYVRLASCMICVILCAFVTVSFVSYGTKLQGQVNYYFGQVLMSPFKSLNTRYGNGVLSNNIELVQENTKEMVSLDTTEKDSGKSIETSYVGTSYLTTGLIQTHPMIGVGMSAVVSEFIGDSQYLTVLHHGGILALFIYISFYFVLTIQYYKKRDVVKLLLIVCIAMLGLAMNIFEQAFAVAFFSYLFTDKEQTEIEKCNDFNTDFVRRRR